MKRLLITLVLACTTLFAFAQDFPANMRMEIAGAGEGDDEYVDNQFQVFAYKDEDGTVGYYLSLGRSTNILKIFRDDITDASFSHVDETCLCMGATMQDAFDFLDRLEELLESAPGTAAEFPCRLATGAERLGESGTATCVVVKRFLQAKRLNFLFRSGNRTAEADMTKSVIKSLRFGMNVHQKLHPEN